MANDGRRIYVSGNYIEHQVITVNAGGTLNFGEPQKKKSDGEQINYEPENVKRAICMLMESNSRKNKRWWFIPYRVLKDANVVSDLNTFEAYINRMFDNNLPVPIDVRDLSKEVEVGCFNKPYTEWTSDKAPFSVAGYEKYNKLIEVFIGFLKQ